METHRIHPELLERQVRVLVVGCGGTGSAVVAGLPYLHQSLVARGHPGGLHVTVLDGDTISPTNCVRHPFARSEVGLNKAIVLVNRLNLFYYSHIRMAAKRVALDSISTPLPDAHAGGKAEDLGQDVHQNGNQIRKTRIRVVAKSLN